MNVAVARDLSRSAGAFADIVWPRIADELGGGALIPVEAVTATSFARDLDLLAGIDAWHIRRADGLMRGIAARVQFDCDFRTFTIRYSRASGADTEFDKRLRAMREYGDWLWPAVTVQAYVRESPPTLLSAASIRTADLFSLAQALIDKPDEAGRGVGWGLRPAYDQNWFLWIGWDYLTDLGLSLWRKP